MTITQQVNRRIRRSRRDEAGATTAEYATTCGVGVGFSGLLYTILTSDAGRSFLEGTIDKLVGLLPF